MAKDGRMVTIVARCGCRVFGGDGGGIERCVWFCSNFRNVPFALGSAHFCMYYIQRCGLLQLRKIKWGDIATYSTFSQISYIFFTFFHIFSHFFLKIGDAIVIYFFPIHSHIGDAIVTFIQFYSFFVYCC